MIPSSAMAIVRATLAGGLLCLAIGSCGRVADEEPLQIDSNTNWLVRCETDTQCSGSLRCYCGQCTQPCASSDECGLLAGAECAPTGGALCSDEPAVGGLCVLGCSEDADCGPEFSCTASQCAPRPCSAPFQSWDDVLESVVADLQTLDAEARPFTRYISLANIAPRAACDGTLSRIRLAINKTLNSLSTAQTITPAERVDVAETLYRIDIRNYGWEPSDRYTSAGYTDAWELLADNNPFAVRFVGAQADAAAAFAGTSRAVMFGDSFIATATRPDVYTEVLGIPRDLRVLALQLGITRYLDEPTFRAGFVARDEFIAMRWELGLYSGYLWDITAVGAPPGALFEDPLRTPMGEHAVIYSLPNGLQAFAFMGADSRWIEDSDTFLDLNVSNFRATAPISLLREHSPRVSVRDEVLDHVRANPALFEPEQRTQILEQYLGETELDTLLDRDVETFVAPALDRAQATSGGIEPISASVDDFNRDMTLDAVAGDLMLTRDTLLENLNVLDPAFSVLSSGPIDRDDFALLFRQALCTLAVVSQNQPDPEQCL